MRLWTWQGCDFDIRRDHYNRERSCFYSDKSLIGTELQVQIKKAYEKLWKLCGTDKFIWCAQEQSNWHDKSRCCWDLNVPEEPQESPIIRVVNGYWWDRIIGNKGVSPQLWKRAPSTLRSIQERDKWAEEEAIRLYPLDLPQSEMWELFWNCSLAKDGTDANGLDVLVKLPIREEWILELPQGFKIDLEGAQ